MFQICFGLYLGGEILAQRPLVGGGCIFYTEFIFKFVRYLLLTSTRNTIFTKFSSFLKPNLLVRGSAKSIGFTVNLLRIGVSMCFALPASSFPRLPVRSAFLCGSHHVVECRRAVRVLPGDMTSQVAARGRRQRQGVDRPCTHIAKF
jgi:hypothetical protein